MNKARGVGAALISLGLGIAITGCTNSTGGTGGGPSISVPSVFESPVKKAGDLFTAGKFAEAQAEAMKAVQGRQDYGSACTILAEILCSEGRPTEAEASAREAVRYEPRTANSHAALARALVGMGQYAEAEQQARAALQLPEATATPTSRAAQQTVLGSALQMQLKLGDAEDSYKAAIQADPKYGPAYVAYGSLCNFTNRAAEAETNLSKATELLPQDNSALTQLVICQTNLGKYDQAVRNNEKLMALMPKDPLIAVLQANIDNKQARYAEAEQEARKALKSNPAFQPAYTQLSVALDKQGRYKEAEGAAARAIQLGKGDGYAWLALAQAFADEKQWIKAGFTCIQAAKLSAYNQPLQAEVKKLGLFIKPNIPHRGKAAPAKPKGK